MKNFIGWCLAGIISVAAHAAAFGVIIPAESNRNAAVENNAMDTTVINIALAPVTAIKNESISNDPVELFADKPISTPNIEPVVESQQNTAFTDMADAILIDAATDVAHNEDLSPPLPQARPDNIVLRQQVIRKRTKHKAKAAKKRHKVKLARKKSSGKKRSQKKSSIGGQKNRDGRGNKKIALVGTTKRSAIVAYGRKLHRWIARHKRYPANANGARGSVRLAVTLSRSGRVRRARITSGSNNKKIDRAALASVRKASPFPAMPNNIPGNHFRFTVTIKYAR